MPLLPPHHTSGLAGAAEAFCVLYCRQPHDRCPFGWSRNSCPLWQFVAANLPTRPETGLLDDQSRVTPTCPTKVREPEAAPLSAPGSYDLEEGYEWPGLSNRAPEGRRA